MASSHFENENLVIISSNDAINMTQWRRYIFDNWNKVNYDSQFTSVLALTCAIVISLTQTILSTLSAIFRLKKFCYVGGARTSLNILAPKFVHLHP